MTTNRQVKQSDSVTTQGICATLQHDRFWLELVHDCLHDRLECRLVSAVIDAIIEREVYCIVLAGFCSHIVDTSSTWEVIPIFVEGHCHDSVCRKECLLYTITVMAIDIDIEDALVGLEQLKDA